MPEKPRSGVARALRLLVLAAAAVLLFRLLGPGGRPAEERVPPPPPPPAPSPSPRLSGRVVRADGSPAPGAVVEAVFLTDAAAPPVTLAAPPAGPEGAFTVPGPPPKWISLKVRARRGPLAVEVDLDGAPGPLDLELRLPANFAVSGIVIAAEDGRPLGRMEVRLGERTAVTDAFGRFQLGELPASLAVREAPALEISGPGRKTLRRPLPLDARADDLLLRVERE